MAARFAICSAVSTEPQFSMNDSRQWSKSNANSSAALTKEGRSRICGTGEKLQRFLGAFENYFSTGDAHHPTHMTLLRGSISHHAATMLPNTRAEESPSEATSPEPVVCGPPAGGNSNRTDSATCEERKQTPFKPPTVSRSLPSIKVHLEK